MGCEASKIPAEGDVFFLDFYLYRTNRAVFEICRAHSASMQCSIVLIDDEIDLRAFAISPRILVLPLVAATLATSS
jgi:hypothetical protein